VKTLQYTIEEVCWLVMVDKTKFLKVRMQRRRLKFVMYKAIVKWQVKVHSTYVKAVFCINFHNSRYNRASKV